MKLKILVGMAGADFSLSPGDETDRFTGEEAQRIIAAGYAVPVAARAVERAVAPAPAETRAPKTKKAGG